MNPFSEIARKNCEYRSDHLRDRDVEQSCFYCERLARLAQAASEATREHMEEK